MTTEPIPTDVDVPVVGAGPTGLTAAGTSPGLAVRWLCWSAGRQSTRQAAHLPPWPATTKT
jgi:thioredoxin reductase